MYHNINVLSSILVTSFIYSLIYKPINFFLSFNSNYKKLKLEKRNYVIKNILKSISLYYLTLDFTYQIYTDNLNILFTPNYIKFMGSIYVGNDLTGLILVKNLPTSTKIHHLTTFILYFVINNLDSNSDLLKLIIIYTIFSFISYLVNFYLALRYLTHKENKYLLFIKKIAGYIYLGCLVCNWLLHIYIIIESLNKKISVGIFLYCIVLVPIINDDIILLKWLLK